MFWKIADEKRVLTLHSPVSLSALCYRVYLKSLSDLHGTYCKSMLNGQWQKRLKEKSTNEMENVGVWRSFIVNDHWKWVISSITSDSGTIFGVRC